MPKKKKESEEKVILDIRSESGEEICQLDLSKSDYDLLVKASLGAFIEAALKDYTERNEKK